MIRAHSSLAERFIDIEEAGGSIPPGPTMEKIKKTISEENPVGRGDEKRTDHVLDYYELDLTLEEYKYLEKLFSEGKIKEEVEYDLNGKIKTKTFINTETGKRIFFSDDEKINKFIEERLKSIGRKIN